MLYKEVKCVIIVLNLRFSSFVESNDPTNSSIWLPIFADKPD